MKRIKDGKRRFINLKKEVRLLLLVSIISAVSLWMSCRSDGPGPSKRTGTEPKVKPGVEVFL
ncbi:MAG TPA: hypothetical protein PLB50_03455, partial [Candidatus Saccharicenans sp.]|nr:hypothetical protein [Candidatus Saccharicenans sp.]HQO75717.1 hypothetical protein [Candidatus Saccharicenans sp.]